MSNALTVQNLPQHLQVLMGNQNLAGLNAAAAGGISAGSWPRISLKGGRFHLQDPQGQDVVVPHLHLDVVIVDANPTMSKIFYIKGYDPSAEGSAPDCYSDNGVGPSVRAASPQCGTCAACPNNVWGSKITPTGSQVKACADVKKIAVLLADNTGGPVFELRVPGASLGNLGAYIRGLNAAGIPAASIITRITFDVTSDYPKVIFGTPTLQEGQSPYITPEMLADVMDVVGSEETDRCVGKGDTAIDPARVGVAATSVIASQIPPAHQPVGGSPQSSLPLPPPPVPHVSAPPLHPSQVGLTPPPNPAFPHVGNPALGVTTDLAASNTAGAPTKRTRRKVTEASIAAPAAPPAPPAPPAVAPGTATYQGAMPALHVPQNAANATAPVHVATTDAALDDMLKKALQV